MQKVHKVKDQGVPRDDSDVQALQERARIAHVQDVQVLVACELPAGLQGMAGQQEHHMQVQGLVECKREQVPAAVWCLARQSALALQAQLANCSAGRVKY